MNVNEFLIKLENRYGKPKNDFFLDDIRDYLNSINVDLERLYDAIRDNHEYESIPNRYRIKEICEKHLTSRPHGEARPTWDEMKREVMNITHDKNIPEIVRLIVKIKDNFHAVTPRQMVFLDTYDLLAYHYHRMIDDTGDEQRAIQYCRAIREQIEAGQPVDLGPAVNIPVSSQRHGRTVQAGELFA